MRQILTGFLVILVAGTILFSANNIRAKENGELSSGELSWNEVVANENGVKNRTTIKKYLGFSPGAQSWDEVVSVLKTAHAFYETDYGYQGYSKILPMIKVKSYKKFSTFGLVKESWLEFTPDKKLYRILVTWGNKDENFKTLKDALDIKYGEPKTGKRGFREEYQYANPGDHGVAILLEHDTSGLFDLPWFALAYTYTPGTQAYLDARKRVDADIKQKNAQKVGSDL